MYIIGRAATADALLNLLIAASMFGAWLHLDTGRRSWLYATFAAIGLGFLAKGPVAILVPLAVTFLFCVLRRDLRTWARAVFDWRGLLLFAVIAVPWYAVIFAKEGSAFFEGFFLRHNLGRFGGPLQGHAGSLVYYFPIVLAWTLPFTALLVPVVRRLRTIWRDDLQLYLLLWFVFVFVFFSLSGTKLPHYVLYGITGLVLLMAVYAHELESRFWALAPAAGFFLVLLLLPWAVKLALPHVPDAYYREALSNADAYFTPRLFRVHRRRRCWSRWPRCWSGGCSSRTSCVATGLLSVLALSAFVVPVGAGLQQEPIKEAALLCRERDLSPILWRLNAPSFSVYRGQPTEDRELRPATSCSRVRSAWPSCPATATTCCTRRTASRWSGFAREPGRADGLLPALACRVAGAAGALVAFVLVAASGGNLHAVPAAQRPRSCDERRGCGRTSRCWATPSWPWRCACRSGGGGRICCGRWRWAGCWPPPGCTA